MSVRSFGVRVLGLAALLAVAAPAAGFWSPRLYTIRGYLDCAPSGATVVDRVELTDDGVSKRRLLVTAYRSSGDDPVRYLSQQPLAPYSVWGKGGDVARLLAAPKGAEVNGTFVLYTQANPALAIANLDVVTTETVADTQAGAASECRS